MIDRQPLVIYGGTFDPVHFGHLRTAMELHQLFDGDAQVSILPCGDPRHRQAPLADGSHRLKMLRLALGKQDGLTADDREIRRSGATYTADTLLEVRQAEGDRPLILVMGGDAFLGLPKWHRWLEIIQLAHIMVVRRPNWSFSGQGDLKDFYQEHHSEDLNALTTHPAGKLYFTSLTQMDISSTAIRRLLRDGHSPRFLLPDAVLAYIFAQKLYGVADLPMPREIQ